MEVDLEPQTLASKENSKFLDSQCKDNRWRAPGKTLGAHFSIIQQKAASICVLSLHMQSGSSKQEGSGKLLLSKQSF